MPLCEYSCIQMQFKNATRFRPGPGEQAHWAAVPVSQTGTSGLSVFNDHDAAKPVISLRRLRCQNEKVIVTPRASSLIIGGRRLPEIDSQIRKNL